MQMQLRSVFYTVGNNDKLYVNSDLVVGLPKAYLIMLWPIMRAKVHSDFDNNLHELLRNFHFEFSISSPTWSVTDYIKQFLK